MVHRELLLVFSLGLLCAWPSTDTHAQEYNALEECVALSPALDDIHACMDNYLDLMDGSLQNITDFIAESLDGDARAGLERSQQAFDDYRRQNCLWYLEFSYPRSEAEQIAKNCLATMSQQRLAELQGLLRTDEGERQIVNGFYVYGSERNSFQPCGSASRYWVEGDSGQLGEIQQRYLAIASSELQVLFASVTGEVDEQAVAPVGHQGVFELASLVDLRVPTDSDCGLPSNTVPAGQAASSDILSGMLPTQVEAPEISGTVDEDVEEQLIGYFGDWLADCTAIGGVRGCRLTVDLATGAAMPPASLSLIRRGGQQSGMDVFFSEQEIDSPARIRWAVDAVLLGDLVQSEIRVDQSGTRLLVPPTAYISEELVPMLMQGNEVRLEVLDSVDATDGETVTGSLMGISDALAFADDFITGGAL